MSSEVILKYSALFLPRFYRNRILLYYGPANIDADLWKGASSPLQKLCGDMHDIISHLNILWILDLAPFSLFSSSSWACFAQQPLCHRCWLECRLRSRISLAYPIVIWPLKVRKNLLWVVFIIGIRHKESIVKSIFSHPEYFYLKWKTFTRNICFHLTCNSCHYPKCIFCIFHMYLRTIIHKTTFIN